MRSTTNSERGLRKSALGLLEASTLLIGGTIGAGIFLVPAKVANEVGSPGLALAVWVVTGLLAVCGALSFAELAAAIPETGGTYAFLRRAYPRYPLAFFYGWTMIFTWSSGAIAITATMGAIYLGHFLEPIAPYGPRSSQLITLAIIWSLAAINYVGVKAGGHTQNILTFLKAGALLMVVALCFLSPSGDLQRFSPLLPENTSPSGVVGGFGVAMVLSIFTYSGWFFVTHVAGEIRDPSRNLPRAIGLGIGVVIVCYLLINAAYIYALPFDVLRASERVASDAATSVGGKLGGDLVAMAVIVAAIGCVNAQLLNYPRIAFRLASEGEFFESVAHVQPTFRTPSNAIFLIALLASACSLSGTYQDIMVYISFVGQLFMMLTIVALFVLRHREPNLPRPYRVWGYPYVPGLYVVGLLAYLVNLLITRPGQSFVGIALTLAGAPFIWYWHRRGRTAIPAYDPKGS